MLMGPGGELIIEANEPEFEAVYDVSHGTYSPDGQICLRGLLDQQRDAHARMLAELGVSIPDLTSEISFIVWGPVQKAGFSFVIPPEFLQMLLMHTSSEAERVAEIETRLQLARDSRLEELRDRNFMNFTAAVMESNLFDVDDVMEMTNLVLKDEMQLSSRDAIAAVELELEEAQRAKRLSEFLLQHLDPPPAD